MRYKHSTPTGVKTFELRVIIATKTKQSTKNKALAQSHILQFGQLSLQCAPTSIMWADSSVGRATGF